ncbi:hypothetical protein KFZ70_08975 [Tamlana fucoidanivorans]|uniref:Uncharacterized protein n=1 Tax=Allotamlana fucoidanivorans TaxID=2583814 RepID=A0A5C4SQA1_9FLAO|nr:hypothetical protein [Tamlana fucoidanivorans]TNJ46106.1 hypothetical protein FGF67_03705 [Tamlana fucoidanivorans]
MNFNRNSKIYFIAFLFSLIVFSCKTDSSFSNFKYLDKPQVLNCEGLNSKLYNEALYCFEDDILAFYSKNNTKASLVNAYSQFVRMAVYGSLNYDNIVSKHTKEVFEALKSEADLWDAKNPKSHLNYNSTIMNCIANNIKDDNLKTTLNALMSTNSMSPKLFGTPVMNKYRNALNDKYLGAYIAFDLYFAKLFTVDFAKVNFDKPEQKVDFNKIPQDSK